MADPAATRAACIYLDHQATTPCDPRVIEAMLPFFGEAFGNAASKTHAFGWEAEAAVEDARRAIAGLIGADARELVFTSGATEANNLAILGAARARRPGRDGIVTLATEHRAVLDPVAWLGAKEGARVTRVGVGRDGRVDPDKLAAAIDARTALVSVMHANNEIGVIQPIAEIAALAHAHGAWLHCDAAQSVGKVPLDVAGLGADLVSFTAHKLYGPKGVGALWLRRALLRELVPVQHGGGHERGLRSGTLPVPLCVGFGVAAQLAAAELEREPARLAALRDRLWQRLSSLPGVARNGAAEPRLPHNLNASFAGVEGEALIAGLPELALSSGSACTSALREPSHVLAALGLPKARALSSLRFGLGRSNTAEQVERAAQLVIAEVERLRALSPSWEGEGRA